MNNIIIAKIKMVQMGYVFLNVLTVQFHSIQFTAIQA
jgi:hypothetical protein